MVGIFADDRLELPVGQELVLAFAQVQDTSVPRVGLSTVSSVNSPSPSDSQRTPVLGGEAGAAGGQRHLVGDDEGGIEADAELADQLRVLLLVAGELREELARAGFGDGADVLDDLLSRVMPMPLSEMVMVRASLSKATRIFSSAVVLEQRRVGQRLEAQLVGGVGRVGNQFAQENLLVGIQRMDHQLQQLLDFGLKAQGFLA